MDDTQSIDDVQTEDDIQDLAGVPDIDSVQGVDDINYAEKLSNMENEDIMPGIDDFESMQGMDSVQNADDVQNADTSPELENADDNNSSQDVDNVQNADSSPELENVDGGNGLQDADDVPLQSRSSQELQDTENNVGSGEEKKWPGWPGENVFRMLIPAQKVGGIIGRKGEFIKKLCEETKARIKILDGPPGTNERAVMVSAKEEPDLSIPPAMEGLLRVHKHIIDLDSDSAIPPQENTRAVSTRLLVAANQAGSLIGKQGTTIKTIQDTSQCTIRVLRDHLPQFAIPDDNIVEVQGEPMHVHKAVEMIATHLRKFLVDRSVIGVFEMLMQMPNARANQHMPPPGPNPSWPPHSGFTGFGPGPRNMPPPRQYDNYYGLGGPLDKQQHKPMPAYDRDLLMQPPQSIVTKVTQNMQIPLTYADAVIGTSGSNISYIRRTSGATIAIQESRGSPENMTVEISGTASQVQTAQQLIQNSMVDAQSSAGGHPTQGYASEAGADYGSVYGANHGY